MNSTNRIKDAFKNGKALIGYTTGGDPTIEESEKAIMGLIEGGADIIELGIPFSDPMTAEPFAQKANQRALESGSTVPELFKMIQRIRQKSQIPIIFSTYLNPVFYYGYDAFFQRCLDAGIDGISIPDLPYEEQEEVRSVASNYGMDLIPFIAPTSEDRIKDIAKKSSGFIYLVPSSDTSKSGKEIKKDLHDLVEIIKSVTNVPIAAGFDVNNPEQASDISTITDGLILSSSISEKIERYGKEAHHHIKQHVQAVKSAIF